MTKKLRPGLIGGSSWDYHISNNDTSVYIQYILNFGDANVCFYLILK